MTPLASSLGDAAGRELLVLVAHADDETLGCGGTLRKLIDAGWRARVVILSDGIITTRDSVCDNRDGARRACELLGAPPPEFLGFADQRFDAVPMADLAGAVGRLGLTPDLVLTHVSTDLNRDHRLVAEVARILARPRQKPVSVLGCEIPSTTFWNGQPFAANFYVDVTDSLDAKLRAMACYGNEAQPFPHPWSERALRLLAEYHGMQCGYRYAEAFSLLRGYAGLLP